MNTLTKKNEAALLAAANNAVALVCERLGKEHVGKGGFFRLFLMPMIFTGYTDLVPLIAEWIGGTANRDGTISRFEVVSCEKAIRLAREYILDSTVRSSMASRNPEQQQHGGAIILDVFQPGREERLRLLFSLSGLPEMGDEAAMLATPQLANWAVMVNDIAAVLRSGGIRNDLAWELDGEFFKKRTGLQST